MANATIPFPYLSKGHADSAKTGENFAALITYLNGLTSSITAGTQYQLAYYATTGSELSGLTLITASRALASNANGLPVASTTTATELGYVNGVTSAIQTQLNAKTSATTYRENYIVGTAVDNYTGSTTVFDLVNNYTVGGSTLIVMVDGVVQTIGVTVDYTETDENTVTFNNALLAGQRVGFLFSTPISNSGVVNSGTAGRVAYYASTGSTVGDTAVITITAGNPTITGTVAQPTQPSFLVTAPTNSQNVTGDSTAFTAEFDTEIFDQASNFATNTYIFTAPVTGRYFLSASVTLQATTTSNTSIRIYIITSNRSYQSYSAIAIGAYASGVVSCVADMDANDTAYVSVSAANTTKIVELVDDATTNYFSGSLIN